MTTLEIPLHMPMKQTEQLIRFETQFRDVHSVKVKKGLLIIEHDRKPTHEIIAEIESCPATFFDA